MFLSFSERVLGCFPGGVAPSAGVLFTQSQSSERVVREWEVVVVAAAEQEELPLVCINQVFKTQVPVVQVCSQLCHIKFVPGTELDNYSVRRKLRANFNDFAVALICGDGWMSALSAESI